MKVSYICKKIMGILNNFFGKKEVNSLKEDEKSFLKWIPLTSIDQLEEIKELSKTESVFVFKHSTRCGISRIVIKQFERLFTEEHKKLKVYYLDLLNYRNVSNEVGDYFQVIHQSPQLLVIKNGVSIFDVSHNDITIINLSRFI
jgi:bacillithiol system protein YtxJ